MNFKLLLLLPILEIISFILFGDILGFFPVILHILVTMMLGIFLLKQNKGIHEIDKFSSDPKDWICKKVAAILFIIPGFVTDFLALMLFFKMFRSFFWGYIPDKAKKSFYKNKKNSSEEIIDVEYKNIDDK